MSARRWLLIAYSFVICSILITAPTLYAQTLWHDTAYGMSVDDVKKVVPKAAPPATNPEHLADGSEELLRLEGIELVNQEFRASFFFKAKRLTQVTLSLQKDHTFDDALRVFNTLTEALRTKYGPEISRQTHRGMLNTAQAEWVSGRTNVNLIALSVGENDANLNVNYQVRLAKEADKL
jgi:hypothetical protein